MMKELYAFNRSVTVSASLDGLKFRSASAHTDWQRPETWPPETTATALGRRTATEAAMALEMGLAIRQNHSLHLPYDSFADLDQEELTLHRSFSQSSPFLLHIDRVGVLGRPEFRYVYRFLLGSQPVPLDRIGPYLFRAATHQVFHLDQNQFSLVDAMEKFNALPAAARGPQASWMTFADVKRLSVEVDATLDSWLQKNDVVVPSSIGVDFYEESDGSLSFVPTSPSLDSMEFRTVFQRSSEAHDVYTIQRSGSERVRVVLSDRQKAVLERMKRVQKVRGDKRADLMKDPLQVFDGIAGDVELPPSYSDRVIGIGRFEYAPVPKALADESSLGALWGSAGGPMSEKEAGNEEDEPRQDKKTLLIETNQDDVRTEYIELARQAGRISHTWTFISPTSLSPSCLLDKYQQTGVEWLQRCSQISGRSGVLLADDMGLGKTLQLLTFLAWAIESGLYPDIANARPPYRPILITAPLILLENQTWEQEMKRFFNDKGNVFLPLLPLYGPELKAYRRKDLVGSEGTLGQPILDLDRIRQHRVVITNYEALRDYEFSFAYHPEGKSLWSIVVSDEAQEFKTPNSRISHAIKKMQPQFRIACTGTPVENRLLDLWNIFDAVQPGLLGSAQQFAKRYENSTDIRQPLAELKSTLLYEKPHAFMLRRSKDEVLQLPQKHEHRLQCSMSPEEVKQHRQLSEGMGAAGKAKQKLGLLHDFARLYQHPALLHSSGDELSSEELKSSSSKLRRVVDLLHIIKQADEKVLLFARHKDAQRMLAKVLGDEFGLPIRILNGDTPTAARSRNGGALTRRNMLDEFRTSQGFAAIVLSPFVAGVGLTLTEANHVIHYGRWWNPAVEAQATDRVYRRGQVRPVHVYLPILADQTGELTGSFDQLLDQLMTRKESLARNTLAKEGFQGISGEESASGEMITALSQA